VILAMRAAQAQRKRERELATFQAWRTATLVRAKKIPMLNRLLRTRRRVSAAERAEILADVAALEAEFARLEVEAAAREASDAS
jgi:hypothetical protein